VSALRALRGSIGHSTCISIEADVCPRGQPLLSGFDTSPTHRDVRSPVVSRWKADLLAASFSSVTGVPDQMLRVEPLSGRVENRLWAAPAKTARGVVSCRR
jgi:hypothetical protein